MKPVKQVVFTLPYFLPIIYYYTSLLQEILF